MSEFDSQLLQPRLSSKVLIVNKYDDLLLLQRSAHDTHRPDQYDLPGGGFEADEDGDGEDAVDCAIRETMEETSIKLFAAELSFLTRDEKLSSRGPFMHYRYFYVARLAIGRKAIKLRPDEHQSFRWSDRRDAINLLGHEAQKRAVALAFGYQEELSNTLDLVA